MLFRIMFTVISALVAALWSLAAGMVISDKRYFLSTDGHVVDETDPSAATLLFGKGVEIPGHLAQHYGLTHLGETAHESRESATLRQLEAAKVRGAVEEVRALEARLPADRAADEADPDHLRRLTGGPAEARAQDSRRNAANPAPPLQVPGASEPRLTTDQSVTGPMTPAGPPQIDEKAQSAPPATKQITNAPATKSSDPRTDGTVDEVAARLESVSDVAELDEIAAAEGAGANRVGVQNAIAARRTVLEGGQV